MDTRAAETLSYQSLSAIRLWLPNHRTVSVFATPRSGRCMFSFT
jgi:hypothetical protein